MMAHSNSLRSPLQAGIENLQADKTNGARVLATNAVIALSEVLKHQGKASRTAQDLWKSLCSAGRDLRDARPSMGAAIGAALVNALDALRNSWSRELGPDWVTHDGNKDLQLMVDVGVQTIQDCIKRRESSVDRIAAAFADWISHLNVESNRPVNVLTLSSSSTLKKCLISAIGKVPQLRLHLKILESRPRYEGATFGLSVLKALGSEPTSGRLTVEIAPDCAVAMLAKDADAVLLGADRISSAGDVSNKIGSLPAAICAKTLSKTACVVAISETDKIARPGSMEEHRDEENEPKEVTDAWDHASLNGIDESSVSVRNVYFEWVPSRWIDAYVSEVGVIDTAEVRKLSARIMDLEDDIFGAS